MADTGENLATATRDRLRRADIEALSMRASQESMQRRVLEIQPDLYLEQTYEVVETYLTNTPGIGEIRFDVRAIKDAILAGTVPFDVWSTKISEAWYNHILENGGIEEARINTLTGEDLKRILIAVKWPQGWTQIIDGNHRLCRRYRLNLTTVRFVLVPVLACVACGLCCEPGKEVSMFMARRLRQGIDSEVLSATYEDIT